MLLAAFALTLFDVFPWVVKVASALTIVAVLLALHSYRWPSVAGRILDARLERESGEYGGTVEHPSIRYEYVVAGRHYEGSCVSLGGTFSMSAGVSFLDTGRPTVEAYPAGSEVTVIFCPFWPRIAFLEGGGRWYLAIFLGTIAAFCSLPWIMMQGRSG